MSSDAAGANAAWEALYRAQATIMRRFADSELWSDVQPSEYAVLYSLSTAAGGKRIGDLFEDALLSQPGLSRLIKRLEAGGLIERNPDPDDGRAVLVRLTPAGASLQRRIGAAHAQQIADAMQSLSSNNLRLLGALCTTLIEANRLPRLGICDRKEP